MTFHHRPLPDLAPRRSWLRSLAETIENSWVGDLIGVICLFGLGYALFFLAAVYQ